MGRLFEFPEIFAQAGDGCRRIKYDFGAIQTERARALREVAVVAYVHANVGELRLEDRIAEIARSEIKLLPKTGSTVWDVVLAIFAQVFPVRIDYGSGVVIDALQVLLVYGDDQRHAVFLCDLTHHLYRWAVGDFLHHAVPSWRLLGTEIGAGKNLLHAQDLCTSRGSLVDELQMLFYRVALDLFEWFFGRRSTYR